MCQLVDPAGPADLAVAGTELQLDLLSNIADMSGPADLAVAGTELQLRHLLARQLDPGQLSVSPDLATLHTFLSCFDMP